ncbi:hypothetical protein CRENBAI_016869 [Crenichthys baileyi]|uniref:Uncharacterized protein n=1 Tax=Crenichthys baileyi TaxID=28760 RepID=A0AAV9S4N3_9TELE
MKAVLSLPCKERAEGQRRGEGGRGDRSRHVALSTESILENGSQGVRALNRAGRGRVEPPDFYSAHGRTQLAGMARVGSGECVLTARRRCLSGEPRSSVPVRRGLC